MDHPKVTVVGAANIDISATPLQTYRPQDSNPSTVSVSLGGVGRNIAHNLSLLGCETRLLTVLSDDAMSDMVIAECRRAGIVIEPLHRIAGTRSNYFVCVNDEFGEMQAGAADLSLMHHLTSDLITGASPLLNNSDAVVADCNPDEETLATLSRKCRVPLYVDATSGAKAYKVVTVLAARCAAPLIVKVNRAEARAITGEADDLPAMARRLLARGATRVYITLGVDGVYCHNGLQAVSLPTRAVHVVNATGAGDAFMSGVVRAELMGLPMPQAAAMGLDASALTLQWHGTVHPEITRILNKQL